MCVSLKHTTQFALKVHLKSNPSSLSFKYILQTVQNEAVLRAFLKIIWLQSKATTYLENLFYKIEVHLKTERCLKRLTNGPSLKIIC